MYSVTDDAWASCYVDTDASDITVPRVCTTAHVSDDILDAIYIYRYQDPMTQTASATVCPDGLERGHGCVFVARQVTNLQVV